MVSKPTSGLPYNISDHLSYENLGSTFYSFVMLVTATPVELAFFHQAVKSTEWRAAMDKEIVALGHSLHCLMVRFQLVANGCIGLSTILMAPLKDTKLDQLSRDTHKRRV